MKNSTLAAVCTVCATISISTSSFAGVVGSLERVDVGISDVAKGWVCATPWAWGTPSLGVLSVYIKKGNESAWHYGDYSLAYNYWGFYRPDIAGQCNGYAYVGFSINGWFYQNGPTTMYVYFKDNWGNLTLLGEQTM